MNKLIFFLAVATVTLAYGAETPYQIEPQSLETQPEEIVLQIMEKLPDADLANFSQTSKKYSGLAQKILQQRKNTKMLQQRELFKSKIQGTTLDLRNTNLTHLMPGVFDDPAFTNLRLLSLSLNQLTALDPALFNSLTNLQVLDLSGNPLDAPTKQMLNQLRIRVRYVQY